MQENTPAPVTPEVPPQQQPQTPSTPTLKRDHETMEAGSTTPSDTAEQASKRLRTSNAEDRQFTLFKVLSGHTKAVSSVKFSPDGKYLASCSADKTIRLWVSDTGEPHHTLQGHALGINDICWSSDSKILASGSDDKNVCIWDVIKGEMIRILKGHTNYVFCVNFNRGSNLLASGSYDESVRIWDVKNGTILKTLPAHGDPVTSVDFAKDGNLLASGSYDGVIRLWDTNTGQCLYTISSPDSSFPVSFVKFTPNSIYLLSSSLNNTIRIWKIDNNNAQERKPLKAYKGHKNEKFCLFVCLFYPATLVSGSEDNNAYIWDLKKAKLLQKLEGHTDVVVGVDGIKKSSNLILATGSMDKTIILWHG